jgi:hypothetical protein
MQDLTQFFFADAFVPEEMAVEYDRIRASSIGRCPIRLIRASTGKETRSGYRNLSSPCYCK